MRIETTVDTEPVADVPGLLPIVKAMGFCPECDGSITKRESGIYTYYSCDDCHCEWAEKEVRYG